MFNLDEHCTEGEPCVGTIYTLKTPLYYDEYLKHRAGFKIGDCTVVSVEELPTVIHAYCVLTVVLDHEGEIVVQGSMIVNKGGYFLITAASGTYAGNEGSLVTAPTETVPTTAKLSFTFA